MSRPLALALALLAALVGCVPSLPGGPARAPRRAVPATFGVGESDAENSARVDWRSFFNDPQLVALIDAALQGNQELNIAVQEALVVNSEVMARRGEYLPNLSFSARAGIDRVGLYTSQGQSDDRHGVAADLQNYSFGLYSSWEVDVWSRLRNAARAQQLRYLGSLEGRNFIITRLVAEIANRYYELLSLDRRLAIVRNNIQLQENALEMVRIQQQAARVTMLAVRRFEAQLQGFQARQFDLQQRVVETENQLNLLLGRFPQRVARSTDDLMSLEPPVVHTGLPSQLLENRPDVRRAELDLRAAGLDVASARAAFYPALRLEGAVGFQSFDIRHLLDTPDSILYNLLAGITAPLLNRAGITAQYYAANSRQMQAVLQYERAILTAYLEVNTNLNLVRNLSQSYGLQRQQVARLAEAVEISTLLFNSARADYLEVLTTRRDSLEAQMGLIETKQRQLTAAVALYQALGGGWRAPQRAAQTASAGGAR
ncbi:MAG: efflux transporter outer membrane subunit [Polyangiales bacterium]